MSAPGSQTATEAGGGLTFLDRPNSYIGRSVPRPNARRLLEGRGVYVDDVAAGARLGHVAFLRSPYAHARIVSIDTAAARAMPGAIAAVTGAELARGCTPWVGAQALQGPPLGRRRAGSRRSRRPSRASSSD